MRKNATIFSNEVKLIEYMASIVNNESMKVVFTYVDFMNKYENQIGNFYMTSTWFKNKADQLTQIYNDRTEGKHWVQFI
jgi:hypothetical protein